MHVKLVTVCVTLLQFLGQGKCHIPVNNVEIQLHCQSICASGGNQAEYNSIKNKLCQCLPGKNIDDIDAALFDKNAKLSAHVNKIQQNEEKSVIISKREITSTTIQNFDTTTPTSESPIATTLSSDKELDINPEGIVGQQPPRRQLHRVVTPRSPDRTRPISADQQRLIVQQIYDHLHRLSQTTDVRLREFEIEAIRSNLRYLAQTNVIQPPLHRSRMRTIEETRRRQGRHRLPHSRLVGASGPQVEESLNITQSTEAPTSMKNIFATKGRHFEIITQDPQLIDE